MNKFLLVAVGVAVLLGGLALGQISGVKSQVSLLASKAGENFGAVVHNVQEQFSAGAKFGRTDQLTISNTGAITSSVGVSAATYSTAGNTTSSSSPAALGSSSAGHIVIAAGGTTGNASTTAVTANSQIFYTVEQVTPIAGTTCNTTIPTSTLVTSVLVAGNGFQVKVGTSPVTNPLCVAFRILN